MNSTSRSAEVGQDRREVAGLLEHRPRCGADRRAELVADDVCQRRLAKTRRPVQQDVIERFATLQRGGNRHLQVLADAVLTDVVVQRARTKPRLVLGVFVDLRGRDESIVHLLPGQFAQSLPQRLLEVAGCSS